MRRGFWASLFAVTCATVLLSNACRAQIAFIQGQPRSVPTGPTYVAIADFNGDRIADAAVSSTIRDNVTILLGSQDGGFATVLNVAVGRVLRGLTTGDFNGDRNQDIVVTDVFLGRVFLIPGRGDGTFGNPGSFRVDSRGPVAVAAGNLDNRLALDLVTANGSANTLSPLFNRGANRGFDRQPDVPIGKGPRDIRAADFNSDGVDDIAVLNTGTRGTDEVSILLNNGVGAFQSIVPAKFTVGVGANSLTVADFNNDGVLDIAVLNAQPGQFASFSVSVLLNQTQLRADGTRIGTGFFVGPTPFLITCPARINGVPVRCFPQDITSADYDADGLNDLAISFSTTAQESSVVAPGFVSAFAGRGDGTFDLATQLIVGLGPRQIASGDLTGDGVPDIVVTEFSENKVRVLRSVIPPPLENGFACRVSRQCLSTFCVNNVCCEEDSCGEGERCDIPGKAGQCAAPADNGTRCTENGQCLSEFCVQGFCCNDPACPSGTFCNTGECAPPGGNGTPCTSAEQCASGFCFDDVCCASEFCPFGQRCDIPGREGHCAAPAPDGTPCTVGGQCLSTFCIDGICCASQCPEGQACNVPGREGLCRVPPPPTVTPTRTPTATFTPTPQPPGRTCASGEHCVSGFCVDGVCCTSQFCPAGQFCNLSHSLGTCASKRPVGQICQTDFDCESGNCQAGNPSTCQPARTATPTPTATPRGPGAGCRSDGDCRSDLFCTEGVCCTGVSCPAGQSCNVAGRAGECSNIPTPTPTLIAVGRPCTDSSRCETLACVNGVCCATADCPLGERCDIPGFKGDCTPPGGVDDPCEINAQCAALLLCSGGVCSPPPPATPTLIPTVAPTATPGIVVTATRSGGCAIGDRASGGSAWMLAAVPLALGVRRFRPRRSALAARRRGRGE